MPVVQVNRPDTVQTMEIPKIGSDSALLDWLRPKVSRLMIEEISENDYRRATLENSAAVEMQVMANPPLGFLAWIPREVLELERWSEPERKEPPSGQRGHIKRLLACTILLRNAACTNIDGDLYYELKFFVETSAATLIQLVRSAIALDGEVPDLASRFLFWVYGQQGHPAFRPFAAFSLLLLTAHIGPEKASVLNLHDLCLWVLAVEAQCREMLDHYDKSERWLVGLNSYEDNKTSRAVWADSARAILTRPNRLNSIETQQLLLDLIDRISCDER